MHRIRALNNHYITIFINFYQLTVVCKIYSEFFISDLKESELFSVILQELHQFSCSKIYVNLHEFSVNPVGNTNSLSSYFYWILLEKWFLA